MGAGKSMKGVAAAMDKKGMGEEQPPMVLSMWMHISSSLRPEAYCLACQSGDCQETARTEDHPVGRTVCGLLLPILSILLPHLTYRRHE